MEIDNISNTLNEILSPFAIETYPFKISWYNECVPSVFKLPHHPDTLCYVAISTPSTFEKAFLPFVMDNRNASVKDPYDQCMTACLSKAIREFPQNTVQLLQDFELLPNRRPKVIMQTAGHVAGAVHYYSSKGIDIEDNPYQKKLLGVCIHPRYGGWFALRGVFIFSDIRAPRLQQRQCPDMIDSEEKKRDLIKLFNFSWRNAQYRDIILVDERYSAQQQEYFRTLPSERWKLIEKWREGAAGLACPIP